MPTFSNIGPTASTFEKEKITKKISIVAVCPLCCIYCSGND